MGLPLVLMAIEVNPPTSSLLSRVILLAAPAANVAVPATLTTPESVIVPSVEMLKSPPTVVFPRLINPPEETVFTRLAEPLDLRLQILTLVTATDEARDIL